MAPWASVPRWSESSSERGDDDDRVAELAIIDAGPVGLYAAYYAGFRGLETLLIESLPMVGGQITAFYPDDIIFDVAGFPEVTGSELISRLIAQTSRFPPRTRLGQEVTD